MPNYPFFNKYRIFAGLLLCFSVAISGNAQDDPDDEIINVDYSMVVVNAVVTDQEGRYQNDLKIDDFQIFEDGIAQQADFLERESVSFAATILLDVSGSMQTRVSLARSAAIRFLQDIRADDHVAIYSFDSKVTLVQDFSNLKDFSSRFYNLEARGYTKMNDAIVQASIALKQRPEKRKAIVILSDGEDTRSKASSRKALRAAQDADASIYTVDMSGLAGSNRNRSQNRAILKKFASETGGRFVKTPGGRELRSAFAEIVRELGVQYTLGYHSTNNAEDGKWRKITIETSKEKAMVRARKGYFARTKDK